MKYKYDAVIFDMDGTITLTDHIWGRASLMVLERRGIKPDNATLAKLQHATQGLAVHKSCLLIKETFNLSDPVEALIAENTSNVHNLYTQEGIVFVPGFEQFHETLTKHSLKTGIATSATPESAALTDRLLNLQRFFGNHIYNMGHVQYKNKPDPAVYLHAAEQLAVKPARCIAIEDSAHGIRAAKCAGLYCIGINTSGKLEQLKEADCIVAGYHEINLENLLGKTDDTSL